MENNDIFISIGASGNVKYNIDKYTQPKETLFFDYLMTDMNSVNKIFENNIDNTLFYENIIQNPENLQYENNARIIFKSLSYCESILDVPVNFTNETIYDFIKIYKDRYNSIINYIVDFSDWIYFIRHGFITSKEKDTFIKNIKKINPNCKFKLVELIDQLKENGYFIIEDNFSSINLSNYKTDTINNDWTTSYYDWKFIFDDIKKYLKNANNTGLKTDNIFISIGETCTIKGNIDTYIGSKETLFFDWLISDMNGVNEILASDDINNILFYENIIQNPNNLQNDKYARIIIKSLSSCESIHDVPINFNSGTIYEYIKRYKRRYHRIINFIKNIKEYIYFIRHGTITNNEKNKFIGNIKKINPNCKFKLIELTEDENYTCKENDYFISVNLINFKIKDVKTIDWLRSDYNWEKIFFYINNC